MMVDPKFLEMLRSDMQAARDALTPGVNELEREHVRSGLFLSIAKISWELSKAAEKSKCAV